MSQKALSWVPGERVLAVDGKVVRLSGREAQLVAVLVERLGETVSREDLFDRVWGSKGQPRAVDRAMSRLRGKIEENPAQPRFLHTVHGVGYRLEEPSQAPEPVPLTPFFGRTAELERLLGFLRGSESSSVVVTGSGGMGKSRLARRALARWGGRVAEGVGVFVPLSSATDRHEVAHAIARAMNLPSVDEPEDQVLAALAERRAVVVLDDVEHLVPLPPIVDRLRALPGISVVATSRRRLGPEWEEIPLSGLPCDGVDSPAVALFVERAERRQLGRSFSQHDREVIARLCARLDGAPLAIELVAAGTAGRSIDEVARRLDPAALGADLLDLPPRQRSLRAVFESSWGLLDGKVGAGLATLALLEGPVDHALAAAVADLEPEGLDELIAHGLVHETAADPSPGPMVALPAAVRLFCREKLARLEGPDRRDRHAREVLGALIHRRSALLGPGQADALAWLRAVGADVDAAVGHAARAGLHDVLEPATAILDLALLRMARFRHAEMLFAQAAAALGNASALATALEVRRARHLARRFDAKALDDALAELAPRIADLGVGERGVLAVARALALNGAKHFAAARDALAEAAGCFAGAGWLHERVRARQLQAWQLARLGAYGEAREELAGALAEADATGDPWLLVKGQVVRGLIELVSMTFSDATRTLRTAAGEARRRGFLVALASALQGVGVAERALGHERATLEAMREAMRVNEDLRVDMPILHCEVARCHARLGEPRRAEEALARYRLERGEDFHALEHAAELAWYRGEAAEAAEAALRAHDALDPARPDFDIVRVRPLKTRACALAALGDERARELAEIIEEIGPPRRNHEHAAEALAATLPLLDPAEAEGVLRRAAAFALASHVWPSMLDVVEAAARLRQRQGRRERARRLAASALHDPGCAPAVAARWRSWWGDLPSPADPVAPHAALEALAAS